MLIYYVDTNAEHMRAMATKNTKEKQDQREEKETRSGRTLFPSTSSAYNIYLWPPTKSN